MNDSRYDIAVIGGGPAGIIAAGRAAELGAKVILIEKNDKLGRKLLMTGNGRCNLSQAVEDIRDIVESFGENGKFLFSALSRFGVKETLEFFRDIGVETKVERGKRVFPVSDSSEDVLNALIKYLLRNGVTVKKACKVIDVKKDSLVTQEGEISAKAIIICTGGKSFPGTGSTGDGFKWAKEMGIHVTELTPSLVPLKVKESWIKQVQGLALKNVRLYTTERDLNINIFGELLFTHFGISGPIALTASKHIVKALRDGELKAYIDLKPALDHHRLDLRIQRDFQSFSNRMLKNSLFKLLPKSLISVIIELSGVPPDKHVNNITKEERLRLVTLLKGLQLTITGSLGFDHSMVTSGGIDIKEIDPKTMRAKSFDNIFFAGEVIDLDGPTGGYNLQMCWTTGYIAGQSAYEFVAHKRAME